MPSANLLPSRTHAAANWTVSPTKLRHSQNGKLIVCAWAGYMAGTGAPYYAGVAAAACHYIWQISTVDLDSRQECLAKFVSNKWFGGMVFTGIVLDKVMQTPILT